MHTLYQTSILIWSFSSNSMKQQFAGKHVASLRHI